MTMRELEAAPALHSIGILPPLCLEYLVESCLESLWAYTMLLMTLIRTITKQPSD